MRYSASVQIKLKVQFACARLSVDPSKKEKAARKALLQFLCDVALFLLAIIGSCLNICLFMTLRLEQSKLMQMSKEPPWNWNNSFSSPENLRKKQAHTRQKLLHFQCYIQESFESICLMPFPLTLGLDHFCSFGNEWRKQGQTSVTWYNSHSVDGGRRRSRCPYTNFFRPFLFLSQIWTFYW